MFFPFLRKALYLLGFFDYEQGVNVVNIWGKYHKDNFVPSCHKAVSGRQGGCDIMLSYSKKGRKMTFEYIYDVVATPVALFTAIIALFNIIVKVNRTIQALEIAVNQLKECIEKQSQKNSDFYSALSDHEIRLNNLEFKTSNEEHTK